MATWNSSQPLRIPQLREQEQRQPDNKIRKVSVFSGFAEIKMGERVPEAMLTEDFIGNVIDQLANCSAADRQKLEAWKKRPENHRIADKWDYLEKSPHQWRTIFPDQSSSILTVGAQD